MIIERAKSNEEAPSQIGAFAKEFQRSMGGKERIEFEKGKDEGIIPTRKEEGCPFCERGKKIPRKEERPRIQRREKAVPCEIEMDLGGGFIGKIC